MTTESKNDWKLVGKLVETFKDNEFSNKFGKVVEKYGKCIIINDNLFKNIGRKKLQINVFPQFVYSRFFSWIFQFCFNARQILFYLVITQRQIQLIICRHIMNETLSIFPNQKQIIEVKIFHSRSVLHIYGTFLLKSTIIVGKIVQKFISIFSIKN